MLVRPTAAVPWLVLGGAALVTRPGDCYRVLREAVPAAAASVVAVGVLVDRVGYGRWVLPLWSFLRFNLLSGGSALYGTHHFLWYYVEGSATVLGPFVGDIPALLQHA